MSDLDITDSVMAELRSAADIVQVIGEHTRLKKAGRSWKGLCPFHNERTPSFTVDREKGLYHCFGCGAGGDVVHFVRQMDRLDFPEAVESLASRFGVTIPRRAWRGPRDDRREKLYEAVSAAHRFYLEQLGKPGNKAAVYLKERDVSPDLTRRLGLGYAPDSWDALSRALLPAYPESLLVEAGLLQPRQDGKSGSYDRFRDRLLFVLRDERGRPVGFGGRTLSTESEGPKYLNSPETPVFQKKRLLYGLSDARDAIRKRDRVVLVEGYFDHLALVAAGIEETVASMGTALTPEQAVKLRRLTPSVVVCYDGDPAGRAATRGALTHLLAQGFSCRVARLPAGRDPHDVLREEGPERLAARIEEAPDYLTWLLEESDPQEAELSSAAKSGRIAGLVELLGVIPDTILRHEECRRLAQHSGVPLELLWDRIKPPAGRPGTPAGTWAAGTPQAVPVLSDGGIPETERALLSLLIQGESISLIRDTLKDEWLTDEGVKRILAAYRELDFPSQIPHLSNENDTKLLARADLEEKFDPSPTWPGQVLDALRKAHLERRVKSINEAIAKAKVEGRPENDLLEEQLEIQKEIQRLKPSRKGKALVD
ncbi:MAG TPA: DNA primase [Thermoanaerobaculia bacterium]|nr:DNA primase [Thermoanaerobaculia bacterium]